MKSIILTRNKIKLLTLFVVLIIGTTIGSCSEKNHILTNNQTTLRVDIGAEGASFDPAKAQNSEEFRVVNDLFAGLVDFDQSNRPIPGMAERWVISPDKKTYTFHLKPNLKFSDGTPITADDFVYSWRRLVDPKTAATYNFILSNVVNAQDIIKGIKDSSTLGVYAPNAKTFVVHLTNPMSEFLVYITAPCVSVVPKYTIDKFGNTWTDPKHIVTSGAYVLTKHVRNGYISCVKNLNYYESANVKINNINYFPLVDNNVGLATYQAGGLDTTWQNMPIDKFELLKHQYGSELHVFTWERINFIEFNMKSPKYATNLKLRQALSMAIDRNTLAFDVLKSGQKPLYSIVTPTIENGKYANTGYSWAKIPRTQQINEAKILYNQAGYNARHPLHITLTYVTNDINRKTAIAIASMWKQTLGVNVDLVTQELKAWQLSGTKKDFDMRISTWGADYNSVTTYTPLYLCGNSNNHSQYCSPQYDTLINQASLTIDSTKQEQLYKKAINVANNAYPIIPLNEPAHQRLVKPWVQNYNINTNYLDNVQSKWFYLTPHK